MKIDLVGPERRGTAMGLNEFAGYLSVAVTALLTGYIAQQHGLRPGPFFVGLAYAGLGFALSAFVVRETQDYARLEATDNTSAFAEKSTSEVFRLTSFTERALSTCSQAGLVNNLNDGMAWGIFPLFFAQHGQSVERIAVLAAVYPAVWGLGQLATGALSDRIGRKTLIASGMVLQGAAIAAIAGVATFTPWVISVFLLGVGTAMVYPTLLAAIGDVADPRWRASSVGTYRFWRDGGFVVGAIVSGVIADALGLRTAIFVVACITVLSGVIVAVRMYETHPKVRR
jgi:MFS family permease